MERLFLTGHGAVFPGVNVFDLHLITPILERLLPDGDHHEGPGGVGRRQFAKPCQTGMCEVMRCGVDDAIVGIPEKNRRNVTLVRLRAIFEDREIRRYSTRSNKNHKRAVAFFGVGKEQGKANRREIRLGVAHCDCSECGDCGQRQGVCGLSGARAHGQCPCHWVASGGTQGERGVRRTRKR